MAPESSFNVHHRDPLSSAPGEASSQPYPPATLPANTTPTTTLATAESRCSAVAQLAPLGGAGGSRGRAKAVGHGVGDPGSFDACLTARYFRCRHERTRARTQDSWFGRATLCVTWKRRLCRGSSDVCSPPQLRYCLSPAATRGRLRRWRR